ncbi:hypothetical protein NMG60_11029883 [Bertholletia excelsa]
MEKREKERARNTEFEFLSNNLDNQTMLTADELFSEGKLLPFWQIHHSEKLSKIKLTEKAASVQEMEEEGMNKGETKGNWFVEDDPSPRPPKCTVLWKELLKLKKQRASSSLSPSSSHSSTSTLSPLSDLTQNGETQVTTRKGVEKTRSATRRIRPMINVPIYMQGKSNALPPLFAVKRGRLER